MRLKKLLPLIITAAAFLTVPFWAPDAWFLRIFIMAIIFSIFATGWNLVAGFAGQPSFGHSFFFGLGAYGSALTNLYFGVPPPLSMIFVSVICGLIGLAVGYPCFRVKGVYFSFVTFALPMILLGFIMYFGKIFGSEMGLSGFQILSSSNVINYYTALLLLAVVMMITLVLVNSNIGLILRGIRDSEILSASVGIDTAKYKLLIFTLSGFMVALSGAFFAHYVGGVTTQTVVVDTSILVIIMTVIGGIGSVIGPLLGAFFITFLNNYLTIVSAFSPIIYGAIIVALLFIRPQGLLPWSPKIDFGGIKRQ